MCIKRFETEIVTLFLLSHFIYKRRGVKQMQKTTKKFFTSLLTAKKKSSILIVIIGIAVERNSG